MALQAKHVMHVMYAPYSVSFLGQGQHAGVGHCESKRNNESLFKSDSKEGLQHIVAKDLDERQYCGRSAGVCCKGISWAYG